MNYLNVYNQLMDRAVNRSISGTYTERHHIVPRSMGGADTDDNMVVLTAREHFIAHILLAKIHGGGMWHAAHMMSNMGRYNGRLYQSVKENHAKQASIRQSGKVVSAATRRKISDNKERAANISSAMLGKQKSQTHIDNWYQSRASNGGWVCSAAKRETQREHMAGEGNPMWGKTHTEDAKQKIRAANAQKVTCPHCGKVGGIAIMPRWHFDNCKMLTKCTE